MPTPRQRLLLMGSKPFDWYVDSINGNDSNSGKSDGAAFKTIGALTGKISAGQKIGLAKGSTWREQLTPLTRMTIASYGSGNPPLLDCSSVMTNASFTKTVGQTYVYQYSATTNYVSGEAWINVWEAGAFLTNVASLALCDSTAGSYYVVSHLSATPIIYIHPKGDTDPTTDGKLYEYSARLAGIYGRNISRLTINGIKTRRNYDTGGSIIVGTYGRLIDCQASEGNKHNIFYSPGSYLLRCTADEAYHAGLGSTLYICNVDVGSGEGVIHDNCVASLTTLDATNQGFSGHINTSGTLGAMTFNNCTINNVGQGISSLAGTTIVNINNCVLAGCARGFTVSYGTEWNITGGSYTYATLAKLILNTVTTGIAINIDGLTATYSSSHATGLIEITKNDCNLRLTNNTFIDNNAVATGYFILSTNTITCYSHNNNFRSPNVSTAGIYVYRLVGTTTMDSDYNLYSKANFSYSSGDATTYTSLAAYVAAKTQDVNSTVG